MAVHRAIDYQVQILKSEQRRNKKPVDRNDTANLRMAKALGVARRTVRRWKRGGFQSCNPNTKRLINLAFSYIPDETTELLEEDLNRHWEEYYLVVAENGQGAVLSQPRAVIV